MQQIGANMLKTKGISVLEAALAEEKEAVISVRGKRRYVVMGIEQYNYLRECELEAALQQSEADIKAGRFLRESADEHVTRLENRK